MSCRSLPRRHARRDRRSKTHPWFVGAQFHPEFKSRPNKPHPLFRGFVAASLDRAVH
ncbi:MAG: hypothetical protein V8T36_12045 [Ruthenibacterium lactatiformans]